MIGWSRVTVTTDNNESQIPPRTSSHLPSSSHAGVCEGGDAALDDEELQLERDFHDGAPSDGTHELVCVGFRVAGGPVDVPLGDVGVGAGHLHEHGHALVQPSDHARLALCRLFVLSSHLDVVRKHIRHLWCAGPRFVRLGQGLDVVVEELCRQAVVLGLGLVLLLSCTLLV